MTTPHHAADIAGLYYSVSPGWRAVVGRTSFSSSLTTPGVRTSRISVSTQVSGQAYTPDSCFNFKEQRNRFEFDDNRSKMKSINPVLTSAVDLVELSSKNDSLLDYELFKKTDQVDSFLRQVSLSAG